MIKKALKKLMEMDRFVFFKRFILVFLFILLFQLFNLTILQGRYYRELSDKKRAKDIQITAQRGEIRDRNGILLAGNRPVFTVQLRKDEIDRLDIEEKNENFLKLSRYLLEDGVDFQDDFPIEFNVFVSPGTDATGRVIEALIESESLDKLLNKRFKKPYQDHFAYYFGEDVLNALNMDEQGPILFDPQKMEFEYFSEEAAQKFKLKEKLPKDTSARQDIIALMESRPVLLRDVLNHPVARLEAYEVLKSSGAAKNIELQDMRLTYFRTYKDLKYHLMKSYPKITNATTAREDFYTVFLEEGCLKLLQSEPAFYDATVDALKDDKKVKDAEDLSHKEIVKLMDDEVLDRIFKSQELRKLAQRKLIDEGINLGISVSDGFQYTSLKNAADLYERFKVPMDAGVPKLFDAMVERYEIDPKLSNYEKRSVLNIHEEVRKQGNYAYIPLNYAYEIKDKTVGRIEENLPVSSGIEVSIEPIRDYPLENSAAHILGYIGKIASEGEVKKYIKEKEYDRNALIGKTGLEETYEEYLHGINGHQLVSVDSLGNTTETLEEVAPSPGKNVRLSIDVNLQQKSEEILATGLAGIRQGGVFESPWGNYNYIGSKDKGRPYTQAQSGAMMVVDVKTGKVLSMASYPAYNPNLFSTGITATDWDSLKPEHEEDQLAPRPLYNIATQMAVQPGSTYKMITAFTAMEEGLNPNLKINDGGFVEINHQIFGCWLWNQKRETHGEVDLSEAIRDSCNYYFYSLGLGKDQKTDREVGVKLSVKDLTAMSHQFGLGESTGMEINIPRENTGTLPDPEAKTVLLKSLLTKHLQANIDKLSLADKPLTKAQKDEKIKAIVSTLENEKPLTRPEVYELLMSLELDPDKRLPEDRVPITDLVKYTYIDQAHWNLADTMNVVIGQGANSYTPAQMARYTMAIANNGLLYDLSLVNDIVDPETGQTLKSFTSKERKVELKDDRAYQYIKSGMRKAALTGGNKGLFENFPVSVALKTGTAERSGVNPATKDTYDSFSWEVAFAPFEDPEIAVVVVAVQGGSGSNVSPMVQSIMAEYFGLNKKFVEDDLPLETVLDLY